MTSKRDDTSQDENRRRWEMSRRRLLQIMGATGAMAAVAPLIPSVVEKVASAKGKSGPAADTAPATRIRQWTMVIDLRRCDGCQGIDLPPQCTTACIQGHFAPQPMEWIQVFEQELPGEGTQFIPTPCMQCHNAPCVNVCPVAATFTTPEGMVLIDQERCIGCRICMAVCPYDRRFFNWGDAPAPPESHMAQYDPEHQFPAKRGTVMKCNFCPHLARAGRLPYCAQACPTNAIYYGDQEEDIATNGVELVKLSQFLAENQAYRLKAELNTKPRVYYIPGHGQAVGRNPRKKGRKATRWPWQEKLEGARTWTR